MQEQRFKHAFLFAMPFGGLVMHRSHQSHLSHSASIGAETFTLKKGANKGNTAQCPRFSFLSFFYTLLF